MSSENTNNPHAANLEAIGGRVRDIEQFITDLPARYHQFREEMAQAKTRGGESIAVVQHGDPGMQLAGKLEALAQMTGDRVAPPPDQSGVYNYYPVLHRVPVLERYQRAFEEQCNNGTSAVPLLDELRENGLSVVRTAFVDHAVELALTGQHASAQKLHTFAHMVFDTDAAQMEFLESIEPHIGSGSTTSILESYAQAHGSRDYIRKAYDARKRAEQSRRRFGLDIDALLDD